MRYRKIKEEMDAIHKEINRRVRKYWRNFQIRIAMGIIEHIDDWMKEAGWPRWKRRQFWREFVKRHKDVLNLAKEGKEPKNYPLRHLPSLLKRTEKGSYEM